MDFNPNSATNTETDREEDKVVEAMKTRLGPLPLLCLVTILNLINGFFPRKAGQKKAPSKPAVENEHTKRPTNASQFWLCKVVPTDKLH